MNCSLQEDVQTVPQREHNVVQHDLILVCGPNDVKHHVALGLVDNNPVVIEDHIVGRLGRLLEETLLECFLILEGRVRVCAGVVVAGVCGRVRRRVVFCEDARVVIGRDQEDRVHAEQGHVRRHGWGLGVEVWNLS
jgi:hypothetical protein